MSDQPTPLSVDEEAMLRNDHALATPTYWIPRFFATLDAERASTAPLDVELLREAIDKFITAQDGFDVDDAEAIAAEYLKLAATRFLVV